MTYEMKSRLFQAALVVAGALLGTGGTIGTQKALSSNVPTPQAQITREIINVTPKCPEVKCPDVYLDGRHCR